MLLAMLTYVSYVKLENIFIYIDKHRRFDCRAIISAKGWQFSTMSVAYSRLSRSLSSGFR